MALTTAKQLGVQAGDAGQTIASQGLIPWDLVIMAAHGLLEQAAQVSGREGCTTDSDCMSVHGDVFCPVEPQYRYGLCPLSVRKDAACELLDAIAAASQAACDACREDACISVTCFPITDVICLDGLCSFADL